MTRSAVRSIADMSDPDMKTRIASILGADFMLMTDDEKRSRDLPVTRPEMNAFIVMEFVSDPARIMRAI